MSDGRLSYQFSSDGYIRRSVYAYKHNAAAVILVHNHPSGEPEPSRCDIQLTKKLQELLEILDVRLLDHFIVAGTETVSMAERGLV
ncbi:JAB domain-containing protein [Escherichia coli]